MAITVRLRSQPGRPRTVHCEGKGMDLKSFLDAAACQLGLWREYRAAPRPGRKEVRSKGKRIEAIRLELVDDLEVPGFVLNDSEIVLRRAPCHRYPDLIMDRVD